MDAGEAYDKAWRSGHRCGYVDAIGEIYDIINKDDVRGDKLKEMLDLTRDLRSRYEKVIEFYRLPPLESALNGNGKVQTVS